MILCAGNGESFSFAKNIGVGLINSAIELTQVCLQYTPKHLLFIGSAGSYDSKVPIGTLFLSTHATQIELSFLQKQSYTPTNNSIKIERLNLVSHETLIKENICEATVNSSNYITNTSAYNHVMLSANILLENMEVFSIFKVAEHFRIPCSAILCVSNIVGENAHEEWVKNKNLVEERLTKIIKILKEKNCKNKHVVVPD
ncbi:purine-nucleoside phosphorylase [Helicobacter sp. MIT 14-3879]|uniref:5'-methylthioadenosine/S-adenosylhomocysteine nucleosidase family protein n=1 Tax=Helicobacter sp. MIT 14-3879 TaxID=2040649 RepID=UPI000E1F7476|nr:purine-nucleoside phosphorylase [Helicobacter sp. MIT 14-3879]RDU61365.1 purine-nucleoside phosphorylase [Helicobacter sp. MIT 14-3879]